VAGRRTAMVDRGGGMRVAGGGLRVGAAERRWRSREWRPRWRLAGGG
jgi:hypothetical protein